MSDVRRTRVSGERGGERERERKRERKRGREEEREEEKEREEGRKGGRERRGEREGERGGEKGREREEEEEKKGSKNAKEMKICIWRWGYTPISICISLSLLFKKFSIVRRKEKESGNKERCMMSRVVVL